MGEVYRARDPRLEREVAIKVLPEAFASDPDRLRRFHDEALTISRLNHPNIVHVYDLGEERSEESSLHFVAMELVEGRTFASLLGETGPLSAQQLVHLARQILEGLAKAHAAGVVHRDLKTDNLMVTDDGWVKILDFGLARRTPPVEEPAGLSAAGTLAGSPTMPGAILGTLGYLSPEQAKGAVADHRSDQFSFGVVLYEMATGISPFRRDNAAESLVALLGESPTPLGERREDLAPALCAIVMRCLAKAPEERFDDTAEVLQALLAAVSSPSFIAAPAAPASDERLGSRHRAPLAGRKEELAQLVSALERAIPGHGRLVTLAGEPGVGKTRLTEELAARARSRGCLVLVGHCSEGEGSPPFAPWIEILERAGQIAQREVLRELLGDGAAEIARVFPELRRLFPDLPPPLDMPPEQARAYFLRCFREFVERAARRQPLVLVLEDVHWADDASLLLLEHLSGHLEAIAALIVGTYRDVELEVARPLAATLRQLVRERLVERIVLRRLDEAAVADLLAGLAGRTVPARLVTRILAETEGNPFFVEEVYLHLVEEGRLFDERGDWRRDFEAEELDVPEGVRLVVGRRLERLDDEHRAALTAAAVIGRRFGVDLLARVARIDTERLLDAIEAAERLGLVEPAAVSRRERDTFYRFSHELIRHTLSLDLSLPRRQRLHLQIASELEAASANPEAQASVLAHHLFQSGAAADPEKTLRFLTLAAQQALDAGAFEDSVRLVDDALSLLEGDEIGPRARLLRLRAKARQGQARLEEAIQDWREALALYEQLDELDAMAETAIEASVILIYQALSQEAAALTRRLIDRLPTRDSAQSIRLLACRAGALSHTGDFETAELVGVEAVARAERLGDPRVLSDVLFLRAVQFWDQMRPAETAECCARAAEAAEAAGDVWRRLQAAAWHWYARVLAGQPERPARWERGVEEEAERLGHYSARVHSACARAARNALVAAPQRDESLRAASRILAPSGLSALCFSIDGLLDFWRGRWEEALERMAGVEEIWHVAEGGELWYCRFVVTCYLGDAKGVGSLLDEARDRVPRGDELATKGRWGVLFGVVEGLSVLDRDSDRDSVLALEESLGTSIAELYPATLAALRTGAILHELSFALLENVAGLAAAAGKRWREAESHFEKALEQSRTVPHVMGQADTRRFLAGMLSQRLEPGDLERAKQLLGESSAIYRRIDMPRHAALAEALRDRID